MIYVDEVPGSPVLNYGDNASAEYTLRVSSTDPIKDHFSRFAAYSVAMQWLGRNHQPHVPNLRLMNIAGEDVNVGDIYEFRAVFSTYNGEKVKYSADTSGGTARVYFGRDVASGKAVDLNDPPPDFKGGIGFRDGTFEGVDIQVPAYNWTVEATYPLEFLTPDYRRLLAQYSGKVNDSAYEGFEAGEVRFKGAAINSEQYNEPGDAVTRTRWRIQFRFEAQPNLTGLTNNDTLEPVDKKGFEAYWILTQEAVSGNYSIRKPVAHYVTQVITEVPLSALQVPTVFV